MWFIAGSGAVEPSSHCHATTSNRGCGAGGVLRAAAKLYRRAEPCPRVGVAFQLPHAPTIRAALVGVSSSIASESVESSGTWGQYVILKGIGDVIGNTNLRVRPSIKSVTQAGEARRRLYRKAFAAYRVLTRIEAGESGETIRLLNDSLVGPLEDWQKFELVVGLKLAETLAAAVGEELVLRPIQQGSDRPIATFGQYDVYWQSRTHYQRFPEPEPSELVTQAILQSYGIPVGADRPDIVICDRVQETVVAIAEAKFSTSVDSWKESFREATAQLGALLPPLRAFGTPG